MIYCLDTDILIEYFRGNDAVKKRVENLDENDIIGLTWLSVYEFFKGIFVSGKFDEEKFLKALVTQSWSWKKHMNRQELVVKFISI